MMRGAWGGPTSRANVRVDMRWWSVGAALAMGAVACGGSGSGEHVANPNASAKPLSTCAKELAEEKPPAPSSVRKATHEIARLLPKPTRPTGSATPLKLGIVPTAPDYSPVTLAPITAAQFIDVSWRRLPTNVPMPPAEAAADWTLLNAALDRLHDLERRSARAKVARGECENERCRTCFDDLVDDDAAVITSTREEILATTKRLRVTLRTAAEKSHSSDPETLLVWAEVLTIEADFLDPNDHETTTLKKESLALFFKGAALPKARPDAAAWLRYGAMREAARLGADAAIPGVTTRGPALELEIGRAFLAAPAPRGLKTEIAYRTAELADGANEHVDAAVLRDAVLANADPNAPANADKAPANADAEASARAIEFVARMYWARAASDEGDPLQAIGALAPVFAARDELDLGVSTMPLLAEALVALGRYEGSSLGRMDVDAFADVAMLVASNAAQMHDLELVHHALEVVWKEAPDTLKLPQALRSLTYSVMPGSDAEKAGKELDALMKLDPSGRLVSPWAESMRHHDPPFSDDVIRQNMLATGVYPPAVDPSRDADARWRANDLAQRCHAGSADGPDLEVEVDASGKVTVRATGSDPKAEWVSAAVPPPREGVRACLERVGPSVWRTFGAPVSYKLVPYQRTPQYGIETRY